MKSDYLEEICPLIGLAYPGEDGFAHNVGTFRFIDLPIEALRKAVALRRLHAHEVLGADFLRLRKKYRNLPPSESQYEEQTRWQWRVRRYFPLRYPEYEYVIRSHKGGKFGDWQDMRQDYATIRDALARCFLAYGLYSAGNLPPTFEGWKQYLKMLDATFARFLDDEHPVLIKESSRQVHTYACGGTGSGKSEYLKLFCHGYIKNPDLCSLVVLEPSSRLVTQLARFKENVRSDRLIYVSYDKGMCPVINPLTISGIRPDDTSPQALSVKRVIAQELLDAISEVVRADGDTQFTVNMKATLMPCILVLLDWRGATLRDLLRFMDDKENDKLVEFAKTRTHYPDAVLFFTNKFKSTDKSGGIGVTKNALYMKLSTLFDTGVLAHLTCGESTIDLEKAVNARKVILFNLSKGKMGESQASAFGRLVVAMLRGIAARRDDMDEKDIVPIHLILDECQNYVSTSIHKVMEEQRKFKLILTLCQTEIGAGMSPALERAVMNGTTIKIAGAAQAEQRKKAANLFPIDEDEIRTLDRGVFITRAERSTPAFRMKIQTHLLDFSNSMTDAQWQATLERQHRLYYRAVASPTPPAPAAQEEDTAAAVWQIAASGKSGVAPG